MQAQLLQTAQVGDESICIRLIEIDRGHPSLDHFARTVMEQKGQLIGRIFLPYAN